MIDVTFLDPCQFYTQYHMFKPKNMELIFLTQQDCGLKIYYFNICPKTLVFKILKMINQSRKYKLDGLIKLFYKL